MSHDRPPQGRRRYPGFYEKSVPIILAFVALAIVLLLGVILAVALGVFPS